MNKMTSTEKLEHCIANINTVSDQGSIIFTKTYAEQARLDAEAADNRLSLGRPLSAIDGKIVSIKDLFDVKGEPTIAGSKIMESAAPADQDAKVVERLRRAGAVVIGKTHMTEFAFSAVGLNPHFGTPGNPYDVERVAGGSSTGAAIALKKGMCEMSAGSDTGGSIRMPSALCGTVGLKPTQHRISRQGLVPLCPSFDTAGAICSTVSDCATLDAVMSDEEVRSLCPKQLDRIRIAVPKVYFQDDMDAFVREAFEATIEAMKGAGVEIIEIDIEADLERMSRVNERATFPNVESSFALREQMASHRDRIDPFIRLRIERGMAVNAAHYIWMCREREEMMHDINRHFETVNFILTPTVPIVAPKITDVADPAELTRINLLLLRNTWVANFFNLPALTLPIQKSGLPVGLQIIGRSGSDSSVFEMGLAVESLLRV